LKVSEALLANQEKYTKTAEKGGLEALKTQIEIVDKSNGAARVLGASPKPEDMPGKIWGWDD
jgi:hypothetical protein